MKEPFPIPMKGHCDFHVRLWKDHFNWATRRESVLGFFDVVFKVAALIVKASQINRLPFRIRDDCFVLPVAVEDQSALPVIEYLDLAENCHPARFLPGRCFVDQRDAFDDPIIVALPVATFLNFLLQPLCPFHFAGIADLPALEQAIEVFATKTLVESS